MHFRHHIFLDLFLQLASSILGLLFQLFDFHFEEIDFVIFLVKLVVGFHRLLSKKGKLLLQVLYSIIGGEHFLLFLGLVLDF